MTKLRGLSDIRRYFYRNDTPIYFVSATPFNLIGIDEWVRRFTFVNSIDCFDGQHPNILLPAKETDRVFHSIEEITNYLLEHKDIVSHVEKMEKVTGSPGKAVFLFFDERTEELCKELGLDVCFPNAALRSQVDNKVVTTRIAEEANVACVPNTLTKIESYASLREAANRHDLGQDLVVQTAYGDSGHTTFFISTEEEYLNHAAEIEKEPEVKVMRKIRCRGAALEACVTREGTIVGPLMTELVGFSELTPYKGGWCGNEVVSDAFSKEVREESRDATFRFGEALRERGYRGYFELDFLMDQDEDKVYLGELNPRITGASSMTNLALFAHADAPLFLFHLLEFSDVEFELDVHELNERWADPENVDSWGQLVMKHTEDSVSQITHAPPSGIWELHDDGSVEFVRRQTHRRTVQSANRAFWLRISKEGDYLYEGADIGILVTPGRLMTKDFELNERAKQWIAGMRAQYVSVPVQPHQTAAVERVAEVGNFKLL